MKCREGTRTATDGEDKKGLYIEKQSERTNS